MGFVGGYINIRRFHCITGIVNKIAIFFYAVAYRLMERELIATFIFRLLNTFEYTVRSSSTTAVSNRFLKIGKKKKIPGAREVHFFVPLNLFRLAVIFTVSHYIVYAM